MYCRNCGAYNDNNANFCDTCGEKLTPMEPRSTPQPAPRPMPQPMPRPMTYSPTAPYQPPEEEAPKKKKHGFGIFLAILLGLVIILGAGYFFFGHRLTAICYVRDGIKGNYSRLLYYVPKSVVKAEADEMHISVDELKEHVKANEKLRKEALKDVDMKGIHYKVTGVESLDKDELNAIKEHYDLNGVLAAKRVTVTLTGEQTSAFGSAPAEVILINIYGLWRVLP